MRTEQILWGRYMQIYGFFLVENALGNGKVEKVDWLKVNVIFYENYAKTFWKEINRILKAY